LATEEKIVIPFTLAKHQLELIDLIEQKYNETVILKSRQNWNKHKQCLPIHFGEYYTKKINQYFISSIQKARQKSLFMIAQYV